jgi:hypothetical protein
MRGDSHVRFGERPGETDPEQSGHRAPGRLNHLHLGTAADNVDDYHDRRWRHRSPLGDSRGAAGRARAIRTAIRTSRPGQTDPAIAAAVEAGHPDDRQLLLAIAPPRTPISALT